MKVGSWINNLPHVLALMKDTLEAMHVSKRWHKKDLISHVGEVSLAFLETTLMIVNLLHMVYCFVVIVGSGICRCIGSHEVVDCDQFLGGYPSVWWNTHPNLNTYHSYNLREATSSLFRIPIIINEGKSSFYIDHNSQCSSRKVKVDSKWLGWVREGNIQTWLV